MGAFPIQYLSPVEILQKGWDFQTCNTTLTNTAKEVITPRIIRRIAFRSAAVTQLSVTAIGIVSTGLPARVHGIGRARPAVTEIVHGRLDVRRAGRVVEARFARGTIGVSVDAGRGAFVIGVAFVDSAESVIDVGIEGGHAGAADVEAGLAEAAFEILAAGTRLPAFAGGFGFAQSAVVGLICGYGAVAGGVGVT